MKQVYVVANSWTYSSGECGHSVAACANEEEARRVFKDRVKDARCDMADASDVVEEYDEKDMTSQFTLKTIILLTTLTSASLNVTLSTAKKPSSSLKDLKITASACLIATD